jgi:hypothetical protein
MPAVSMSLHRVPALRLDDEPLAAIASTMHAVFVLLLLFGAGCRNFEGAAVEAFSKQRSCPESGVAARVRDDLGTYDLQVPMPQPPEDIAGEPSRLAVWQAQQQETRSRLNSRERVYEVTGCNERRFATCANTPKKYHSCVLLPASAGPK